MLFWYVTGLAWEFSRAAPIGLLGFWVGFDRLDPRDIVGKLLSCLDRWLGIGGNRARYAALCFVVPPLQAVVKIYPSGRHAELQAAIDRLYKRQNNTTSPSRPFQGWFTRFERWFERTWLEIRLRELADVLENLALFKLLLLLGRLALLLAIFNWLNGSDARLAQKHREAWQVINSALVTPFESGQSTGEGGRIKAIETLYRGNQSLSGLYAPGAYLAKLNLSRDLCVPSELSDFKFDVLFDPRAYLPYSHTNYNPRWQWHWPIVQVLPWRTRCVLTRGKFSALAIGANLQEANLTAARLGNAALMGSNLSGARLADADLSNADLDLANLSRANLSHADLRFALLVGSQLPDANFRRAKLDGALLSKADLSHANLEDASLDLAQLERANLRGAVLWRASLRGASLSATDLQGAELLGSDLRETEGLTPSQFLGANPPFVCHTQLPGTLQIDPDRDCDRFVRYRIERFGDSQVVAMGRIESALKPITETVTPTATPPQTEQTAAPQTASTPTPSKPTPSTPTPSTPQAPVLPPTSPAPMPSDPAPCCHGK
ncbi:MAG: pentapeptide repeat-containing protein [Oscillatoriales cyanobacterium]|nr:MAG: pentapeptide repeat-containing protein [Oscillatoriales cyanobacterium]